MKVLFDHPNPFALAHGGFQIQIEQTLQALRNLGVEVEPLRWWDATQTGDLIHYFGRPDAGYIRFAHGKGMKVVVAELLTGLGSRGPAARIAQKSLMRLAQRLLPTAFTARMAWDSYRLADAFIALTPWEAQLMTDMFDAPPARVHVVPNGVDAAFLESKTVARGNWIVCTATITERKRVAELAEAAVLARVPVRIIGKPYAEADAYAQRFLQLARQHPELIRYEGPISDRVTLAAAYREARGFALLSTMESLSLSALEAAACECPLLLSDLPWARSHFGNEAHYCPIRGTASTAVTLRQFYDAAPGLKPPRKPDDWTAIGRQFLDVYQRALGRDAQPTRTLGSVRHVA